MTAAPPLLAERALALAVGDPEWRDAILGDLREEFLSMARRHGLPYARRWYWAQAVGVAAHRAAARVTGSRRSAPFVMPEPPESRAGSLSLFWHDLRSAWRSLRHQPALSLTVVAMLALGLAANATIFAQADAIVLRPFRYPGVDRAAVIASDSLQRFYDRESVAPGDFLDWRAQARDVFDRLAAIEWWDPQYLLDGPPQQLTGFLVAPEMFEIVGEAPLLGRTLIAADATGQTPVVVLGYEFWRRQFGARPDVLGRHLKLAGVSRQVVGVMPASFRVPYGSDVWAPLVLSPEAQADRSRGYLTVLGRLAPGVTMAAAEQRLQAILVEQRRAFPDSHAKREVSVRTFTEGFGDAGAGPFVAVWQVAAFVLLLVACANVANLLLARNTEREREFSVRLALGASGGRLARQMLVEGALLAATATALAFPLAWAALGMMRSSFPDSIIRFVPGWAYLRLEPRTLLATAALAAGAVLLFAIAPAWRAAHQNVASGLRMGNRQTDRAGRQRARGVLAAAQIALTLALLVAAGLSLSALYRVTEGPLGFDPNNVLVGRVSLPEARYQDPESRRQLVARVLARLERLPSVKTAAATSVLPYSANDGSATFWREGVPTRQAEAKEVASRRATPTSFAALGIPLLSGRMITSADRHDGIRVAIVSQTLATRFWPGEVAIGKRFRIAADGPLITVVGIVGEVTQDWLVGSLRPAFYLPFDQDPTRSFFVVLRTVTDPIQLAAGLRAAVQAEDPELPVVGLRTMEGVIEDRTVGLRFAGRSLGVIAAISAILAAVGIYSLMAFLMGRRRREMGVRMALGATSRDVVWLSCRQAMRLTSMGIVVGVVLSYLVGRGLEAAMFGVVSSSPTLVALLAVTLAATALAASYLPARRVSRVDPTIALRSE
jgi:predicted permease